ncbi:hypothetical protein ABFP60_07870 [Clostridioides difficile]
MKKNWSNPELKSLELQDTNAEGCPGSGQNQRNVFDCLTCNDYCKVCGGCKNPRWVPGNHWNVTECDYWFCCKACNCKQGS